MKTLLLIDAHALIHRAFHALPPLTSPQGEPIGAIYGLASILLKTLKEESPDYIAAAFDTPEPTFRKEMFDGYKAHRPKADDGLISQIIKSRELFEKFGIPRFEKPGYEADDIIGTFVQKFKHEKDLAIVIFTGDLDTLQLVEDDHVVVQTPKKGISELTRYNEMAVKERYGLSPSKLTDYKGLVGDSSDNIPGVKGIGPKTASKLINEYGSLENLLANIEPTSSANKKIIEERESALFSKRLSIINCDVPFETSLENLKYTQVFDTLIPYLAELGFESLVKRIDPSYAVQKTEKISPISTENILFITDYHDLLNKSLLLSPQLKVALQWKPFLRKLINEKKELPKNIYDLTIGAWLLDPDRKDFSFETLSKRFLRTSTAFNSSSLEHLFTRIDEELKRFDLRILFEELEMPLIPVLSSMEESGILLNETKLLVLQEKLKNELEKTVKEIYEITGTVFNVNSPKQVGDILFNKLMLLKKKMKKTPGGQLKTDYEALMSLKGAHPIIDLLLLHREDSKALTGFVEPLLTLQESDKRIRTNFLQTGAATGRIASSEPNLQNIPQESKWAHELRDSFESSPGYTFLSLDYSQIELRILAHLSQDEKLLSAFREGKDIHTITASLVFEVKIENVTPPMRRSAKTLNFGIIYGMGARAFSAASGFSFEESKKFIADYFKEFPNVREWQEKAIREAGELGYVTNIHGRKRWFTRSDFARAATNMPIQSLGADIVKKAMIATHNEIMTNTAFRGNTRLLLSIHDELFFEVRNDMVKEAANTFKEIMESVENLSLPLLTETKSGLSWGSLTPFNYDSH